MSICRPALLSSLFAASLGLVACSSVFAPEKLDPSIQTYGACVSRDAANWAKMDAFLAANRAKPGVKVTPSGLQYRVIKPAANPNSVKPVLSSMVQVRYRGTLINGELFDETAKGEPPAEFGAGEVIQGWQEALTMMREGEVFEVVIPSDLAYGCKGSGSGAIPPDQVLVFEIELVRILPPAG